MLLAIDIGNTQTACGIFDETKLVGEWRYPTDRNMQVDTCAAELNQRLLAAGVKPGQVAGCIISCVVPSLSGIFRDASINLFGIEPLFVSMKIKTGISVKYENPEELGADRIANAAAVHHLYPGDAIIVDFGTATTFCVLSGEGEYVGGVIAPGVGISKEALTKRAVLLPEVELQAPAKVIGKNTVESMQIGLVYGFAELADGIVRRLKKEFNPEARVIAAGGWAGLISPLSQTITTTDPSLTLKGLQIIYRMNF
jgi:type III pantothenate kinase